MARKRQLILPVNIVPPIHVGPFSLPEIDAVQLNDQCHKVKFTSCENVLFDSLMTGRGNKKWSEIERSWEFKAKSLTLENPDHVYYRRKAQQLESKFKEQRKSK